MIRNLLKLLAFIKRDFLSEVSYRLAFLMQVGGMCLSLVAFYFMEQDVAEVSSTLGLPEGTVKARLHRGRAQLKKRLERILGVEVMAEAS